MLLLKESWDWSNTISDYTITNKWTSYNAGGISTSTKRTGNASLYLDDNWWISLTLANQDTLIVGVAIKFTNATPFVGGLSFIELFDGSSAQCSIGLNTAGKLVAFRGKYDGTTLGTGSTIFSNSGFYYVETKIKLNGSTGTVEVRVNGNSSPEINLSSQNTITTANAYATSVRLANSNGGNAAGRIYLDDVYICDTTGSRNNSFLGDFQVYAFKPNGAGNYSQFTPSAGSNYQNVDDGPSHDSDSTYNSSSTNGNIDSYTMENLPVSGTVRSASVIGVLRKDDVGARNAALGCRSNTTDSVGSDIVLSNGYAYYTNPEMETDPATTTDWTTSGIDALETLVKVTS